MLVCNTGFFSCFFFFSVSSAVASSICDTSVKLFYLGIKQKWVPMDIDLLQNDRRKKNFPPGRRDFAGDRRPTDRSSAGEGENEDDGRRGRKDRNDNEEENDQGRPSSANARISGTQGKKGE